MRPLQSRRSGLRTVGPRWRGFRSAREAASRGLLRLRGGATPYLRRALSVPLRDTPAVGRPGLPGGGALPGPQLDRSAPGGDEYGHLCSVHGAGHRYGSYGGPERPGDGGVQIVAFQTPEPKPAELVAPPEPSPPARKPKPAPLPPPSPEKVAPEPELARKLQVIPPRAPEAPRVAPKPRPAARREAKRPERVPDRPELRIDALAVAPRAPEPPPARLLTARAAAPSVPLPSRISLH